MNRTQTYMVSTLFAFVCLILGIDGATDENGAGWLEVAGLVAGSGGLTMLFERCAR